MANMRMLIRIVFVIFIAKGIDCLGGVCDDCCDCFKEKKEEEKKGENNDEKKDEENKKNEKEDEEKKDEKIEEYEEIEEDEINTAISLVNDDWYKAKEKNKENKPILKIFKKKDDGVFPSKDNGDKISIKLDENKNPKIVYQKGAEDEPNLGGKKYAFFEIKTQKGEMVYLYCSDVESSVGQNNVSMGIFDETKHVSISVIACDTEKVTDMSDMFFRCSGLTVLDLEKFNTTNVKNMMLMFANCSNLTKLDLKNFNTTNVEKMEYMFYGCSNLKNLELGKDFNTTNVTTMSFMFCNCKNLTELEIVEKFNITNVKERGGMLDFCNEDIKNKILGKNE